MRKDETTGVFDVAVDDGLIYRLGEDIDLTTEAGNDIPCDGMMLTPPFVDAHQHLDVAFMLDEVNRSGTLSEAIEINTRLKKTRSADVITEHARQAIIEAMFNGTCHIRTHVDVDSKTEMRNLHPILELRQAYRNIVDIQVVAFIDYPLAEEPKAEEYLRAAMSDGADLVGGTPEFEPTPEDARRRIQMVFDVATSYDADIDLHIDETHDPNVRTLEILANMTIGEGYQGRVTAGHVCALAAYPDEYARRVIEKVAEAGIHIVTNPLTNLYLQGRSENRTPVWRGITRVKELQRAGVNVACGLDDIRNVFLPYGRMNMMEVAQCTSLVAHMTTPEEIQQAFDMPRYNAAKALRIADYGIAVGHPADFVILPVETALDALRLQPLPRYIVRGGRLIAENRLERVNHM